MDMKKVVIYTTPTCTYCKLAKQFFRENNIEYQEYDVATDIPKRNEMIERSGQMGVPVIDIEGKLIVGFDEMALRAALGL